MTAEIIKSTKLMLPLKQDWAGMINQNTLLKLQNVYKMLELKLMQFMEEQENRCIKEALIGH